MSSTLAGDTNHYAAVYGLNCRKLKDSILVPKMHSGGQWNSASGIFIISVLGMNELRAIAELNSIPKMHHVLLRLKQ